MVVNTTLRSGVTLIAVFFFASCVLDSNRFPDQPDIEIKDITVENLNGGARIKYRVKDTPDFLYLIASYPIGNNRFRQIRCPISSNSMLLEGFAKADQYEVTLNLVSRNNELSDSVVVTVHPQTPHYILTNSRLAMSAGYGGVRVRGPNISRESISIHILSYNDTAGVYKELKTEKIKEDSIDVSVFGLDSVRHQFGFFTSDGFGNISDTTFVALTPLYEQLLDKARFYTYRLPSDSPVSYGWELKYFFDGKLGEPGWHTAMDKVKQGTFCLGVLAKISRIVLWSRPGDFYGYQNVRKFTIWGSDKSFPRDSTLPANSSVGTIAGDWVNMGNLVYPNPPSGLPPGQADRTDIAFGEAGVNFIMPKIARATRFIRFECTETWAKLSYLNAMEISLYGDILKYEKTRPHPL